MAGALDFDEIILEMIQLGLAVCYPNGIAIDPALERLSTRADQGTFVAIARILLTKSPPLWLSLAVHGRQVFREYIPQVDLENLRWIDPELDQFLVSVNSSGQGRRDDAYAKRLGDAAEFFVFSALKMAGAAPIHVAKFSDAYGYDIECPGARIDRIEVKAASRNTQGSFYISRNEFDKSVSYGKEWRLIQLTFSNRAFVDDKLNISHVESIQELKFGTLQEITPPDTDAFCWTESALITAPMPKWHPAQLTLDPDFVTMGFRTIA